MGRSTRRATVRTTEAETVKVGDTIDLGPGNHYVRFPDGVVVTARSDYVVTDVPGDYAALNTDGEVVKTFTVQKTDKKGFRDAGDAETDA